MADDAPVFNPPVVLTEAHDASAFDSGEPVLDEWLRNRAWANQQLRASRTYVLCPVGTDEIAGYFALSMGHILGTEVVGSMRRNMPPQIPALLIGRLAIDRKWHGKGLGKALLKDIIGRALAADAAVRLIIVHAISPAAEAFYVHHGFTRLPVDTPTYALDLVKLKTLIDLPSGRNPYNTRIRRSRPGAERTVSAISR